MSAKWTAKNNLMYHSTLPKGFFADTENHGKEGVLEGNPELRCRILP